ncbi:hypothetical protein M0802_008586 [Mischocyttarus mexicanus]|nr:hypothetical protein M0802_008586 [Mischocyttarus mexicanus]
MILARSVDLCASKERSGETVCLQDDVLDLRGSSTCAFSIRESLYASDFHDEDYEEYRKNMWSIVLFLGLTEAFFYVAGNSASLDEQFARIRGTMENDRKARNDNDLGLDDSAICKPLMWSLSMLSLNTLAMVTLVTRNAPSST